MVTLATFSWEDRVRFLSMIVAGTCIVTLTACSISVPVNLYPVKGPLSEQQQKPVLTATAHDVQRNTGQFDVIMPNGEKCTGQWSSAAGVTLSHSTASLFSQYGTVTGFATSISNVPGVNRGQAMSFCPSGRTLEAEFVTGSGTANGYGIAKDSDGNIYKMLF